MSAAHRLVEIAAVTLSLSIAPAALGQSLGDLSAVLRVAERLERIEELEEAGIFLVQNATDDDVQAVIVAEGGDLAIARLLVFGPQGRLFVNARFRDGDRLGIADVRLDSPEPPGLDIEKAYPEGEYFFAAFTVGQALLVSEVELSYDLLPAPVVTFPAADAEGVPVDALVVTWQPIEGAEALVFEIEHEEEERTLAADLAAEATEFALPPGWLQPGTEYVIDLEAVAENGNVTVTDLRFTTAD